MSTKTSVRNKQYIVINNTAFIVPPATSYGPTNTTRLIQVAGCNRTRTGVANPKWRSQIILGENASTDFTASQDTAKFFGQKYDKVAVPANPMQSTSHSWGYTVPLAADLPALPAFLTHTKADNKARQKFYKNAVKAQRFLQSGVFIGELRQTLGLIRNPAKSARLLIDVLAKDVVRRARPRKGGKQTVITARQKLSLVKNAIADSWLEFSFGWSPLASDIDAAAQLLASLALRADHEFAHIEGSGDEIDKRLVASSLTGLAANRPFGVLQNKYTYSEVFVKYYGRIRLDVPSLADGRLMSGLGITAADIIPTAWELVPWSFFVDYFSNIGDVLEAWSYPAAKLAWASKVVVEERTGSVQWSYDAARTKVLDGTSKCTYSIEGPSSSRFSGQKRVTRTATVFVRPPELQFELPFSSKKIFNIGALLAISKRRIR